MRAKLTGRFGAATGRLPVRVNSARSSGGKGPMKKYTLIVLAIALLAFVGLQAQNKSEPGAYEYAIVKWDGPDRLYYNLPQSFVLVHVRSQGVTIPKDAQEEEWCLTYAANQ